VTLARTTLLLAAALAVPAAVPAGSALAAKLSGGAHYSGHTSQGSAVRLTLTRDGRRVARLRIDYTMKCDNDRKIDTYTVITRARLSGTRHVLRGHGHYTAGDDSHNEFHFNGRVSRRRASGTFSLVYDGRGDESMTCRTGKLKWSASRQ
jgi:hypothetical protein